jgi:acyl-CoA synthetase (AMP-forming)/AMP-acid ligase II
MALSERVKGMTVAAALSSRATRDPEGEFLVFQDQVVTFGQVEARSEALAASLFSLGLEAGDRVALILPPRPEFVVAMFAAAKLGAGIVPLNPRLTRPELHYMLRHSEAVAAVTVEDFQGTDFLELFDELLPQLPELQYVVTVGQEDLWYDDQIFQFEDLLSAGEGRDFPAPALDSHQDLFALLYTAGTMGKPKGVELTHQNLLTVAAGTAEAIGLKAGDRSIGVTAFFHVFGIGPGILGSILSGSSLVLQSGFHGPETLDLIQRHRVTVHYGVPTLFWTELQEQMESPRDLSSLRVGLAAGAPFSDGLIRAVVEEFCPDLRVAYSLTEAASVVSLTGPDDSPEKRAHTVGRPLFGTEVLVVGNQGETLPPESVGEIALRGPGVMKGYYRQPEGTQEVKREDGFLLTGDMGLLDEEGYLHLVGRRIEVIIRHGFSVYPREVEERLQAHPAVREAAVVGIPDGERKAPAC